MKTIYVKKKHYNTLRLDRFPSAGPNAVVSGMKEKYWGRNALVLKCGQYVYNVDFATYDEAIRFLGGK